MGLQTFFGFSEALGGNCSLDVFTCESTPFSDMLLNRLPFLADGELSNLKIQLETPPGAGKSWTVTVIVDATRSGTASASALTVTIADTATDASDLVHTVTIAAGSRVAVKFDRTGATAATRVRYSCEFRSTNDGESVHGLQDASVGSGNNYFPALCSGCDRHPAATPSDITAYSIVGCAGSLLGYEFFTELFGSGVAPGGGKGWNFTVLKYNGTAWIDQDGSGGTVDTRATLTGSDTWQGATFDLPLVPGDRITIRATVFGSPGTVKLCLGVLFRATTDGESNVCRVMDVNNAPDSGTTEYALPSGNLRSSGWSATETDSIVLGNVTPRTFSNLWLDIALTAGTGSPASTLTMGARKNGVTLANPTVTVSSPVPSASDSGDWTIEDADTWTMVGTSGTGSPRQFQNWTLVQGDVAVVEPPEEPPEATFTDGEVSYPLTMLDLTDRVDTRHVFAEVDLCDAETYMGGYKRPWALHFHTSRGLSDRSGQMEHSSFSCQLSDAAERFFRGLLGGATTKFVTNRPLAIWMIDDRRRRLEQPWRLTANGFVAVPSPDVDMTFGITGTDWLKARFTQKRAAGQAWQPTITVEDFPNCPEETLGKAAQVIYGSVNDASTGRGAVSAIYVGRRGSGSVTARVTLNSQTGYAGTITAEIHSYITCVVGGVEGPLSPEGGNLNRGDFADPHGIRANWGQVAGVDSYRIYFFWGPTTGGNEAVFFNPLTGTGLAGGTCRVFTHDNSTFDGFGTQVYEDFYVAIASAADGAAYSGPFNSSGSPSDNFHEWLIAAHACKEIVGGVVYVDGRPMSSAELAGDLFIPGTSEWTAEFGADTYVDINSHRYTLLRGVIGAVNTEAIVAQRLELTLNVDGIETVGDSSGDLIRSPAQQAEHFAQNYLAPLEPYRGGLWLDPTYFEHPPEITGLSYIDEDTFDAVDTAHAARLNAGSPSAGYETCGVIGAQGTLEGGVEVLARIAMSGDFDLAFSRKGQLIASAEPIASVSGVARTTELLSIHENSFRITDEVESNFFNILPFSHTIDFTAKGETHTDELRDDDSIDDYLEERVSPEWVMSFCRATQAQQAATLVDSLARKLARFRDPRRRVTLTLSLEGMNHDLGDVLSITHVEGVSATGWLDHLVRCIRHEVDPTDGTVVLDCYDIEPLFGVALSDEDKAIIVADLRNRIAAVPVTPVEAPTIPAGLPGAVGTGDVVGPGSATDNAIARFNGTTGKLLQNSAPIVQDDGRISTVTDPTSAQDAATKTYVDSLAINIGKRTRVRAATTAPVTIATALNNADTLDGVTLATGDLVLVKDQSSAAENGVYVVGVSPARSSEYDTYDEHPGSLIAVEEGTANADTLWLCTSNVGGTLNSTAIAFSALGVSGGITQLTGDVTAGPGTGSQAATIAADAVTNAQLANMVQATVKGRAVAAGTGDPTDLTATQATAILNAVVGDSGSGGTKGLAPAPGAGDAAAGKFLKADATYAVPAGTGITQLTGDVTAGPGAGSVAATIANDAVSYAKMQDVSAASRLLGRGSASGSGNVEEITAGNNLSFSGTTLHVARALTFGVVMDDGTGVALTAGVKGFVRIPVACTITKWTVLSVDAAATAGSISIDLWRDTLANYPPAVGDSLIGGGTKPALSTNSAAEGSSLGGWTSTAIVAGDIIAFAAEATPGTVTRVLVEIEASIP